MRKFFTLLLLTITLTSISLAQSYISVFTESKGSKIFIDGENIGTDQVIKHPVESGPHYVVVKWKGETAFSKTVTVKPNEKKIVVAEEFVEYKTDIANRGAVEMEAARIRETRGNTAFGFFGGSPVAGLSIKHWFTNRLGLQVIGFTQGQNNELDSRAGGRLLVTFSDRVLNKNVFSTYMALGAGKTFVQSSEDIFDEKISEISIGIELNLLGNIAQSPQANITAKKDFNHASFGSQGLESLLTVTSSSDEEYASASGISQGEDMVLQLAAAGVGLISAAVLSITHWSVEVGFEQHYKRYYEASRENQRWENFKISGGAHVYF